MTRGTERMIYRIATTLAFLLVCLLPPSTMAFVTMPPQQPQASASAYTSFSHSMTFRMNPSLEISSTTTRLRSSQPTALRASALDQMPNESNSAYLKRLSQLAADPQLFEQTVMSSSTVTTSVTTTTTSTMHSPSNSTTTSTTTSSYVRAEEWDEQRHASIKKGLSWDERVQYEGQRFGNQYQQNEILRHNLKGF